MCFCTSGLQDVLHRCKRRSLSLQSHPPWMRACNSCAGECCLRPSKPLKSRSCQLFPLFFWSRQSAGTKSLFIFVHLPEMEREKRKHATSRSQRVPCARRGHKDVCSTEAMYHVLFLHYTLHTHTFLWRNPVQYDQFPYYSTVQYSTA